MPLFDDTLFNGPAPLVAPATPTTGYLGRFQLGDKVPLTVKTVDGTALPVTPDAAPVAVVSNAGLVAVATVKLAMAGSPTVFSLPLPLGPAFSLGTYSVAFSYAIAGVAGSASATFDIIGGGDVGGRVISMYAFDRPEARYVVAQLDSKNVVQGRNPSL